MEYVKVLTAVMLVRLSALNASPVMVKSIFSRMRKVFSSRRSTFAVRGIWKALGGKFGKRFVPPAPRMPEEIAEKHPTVPALHDLPLASRAGAVPESNPV